MARTVTASGPLVLVIEADDALRHIMALGLRQRGLRVLATPSLRIAWELLDEAPAIAVLDIGVGATSEWMWPRLLQRHRLLRTTPVVLLAWECPLPELAATASRQWPTRLCLAKPFDARALYAAVDDLLAGPAPSAAPVHSGPASDLPPVPRAAPAPSEPGTAPDAAAAPVDRPPPAAHLALAPEPASPRAGASAPPGPLLSVEIAEPVARAAPPPSLPSTGTPDTHAASAGAHGLGGGAASEAAPGASIWPLVTAGCATLTVAGFFIRPVYALVGLFLLILLTLWWSTALVRPTPHV